MSRTKNNKKIVTLSLILVFVVFASKSFAESYLYHPRSTLYPGASFDPFYPERSKMNCIQFDGLAAVDSAGSIKTFYKSTLIKNRADLFNQLNISASFGARTLIWDAGGSVNYFSEHKFHSDSVTWMVFGLTEYGRYKLNNPRLNEEARQLLKENKQQEFETRCGSEFISQERKGVMISIIFSIDNVSHEDTQRLEASFNGSFTNGTFGTSAQVNYQSFFAQASKVSKIKMSIYSIGGNGITQLSDLMTVSDDLTQIQSVMKRYMDTLTVEKGVPIEYLSGSMKNFGWKGVSPINAYKREKVLATLFYEYQKATDVTERLNEILWNRNSVRYSFLSQKKLDEYADLKNRYSELSQLILTATEDCYEEASKCVVPKIAYQPIFWPQELVGKCERGRISAYSLNLISDYELKIMRELDLVPYFESISRGVTAHILCSNINK